VADVNSKNPRFYGENLVKYTSNEIKVYVVRDLD